MKKLLALLTAALAAICVSAQPTPAQGVSRIIAGTNVTISPSSGTGTVTISATGGSGSGTVTSVGGSFTGGLISVGGSPVTTSGTLALTVAGTSGGIPYFSSSSTWASSGVLAANALVIGGGAGTTPSTTTTATGILTFLGTPSGANLASALTSALPLSKGGTGLTAVPGSDTYVIFNDGSAYGGDSGLTYNKTTDILTAAGGFTSSGASTGAVTVNGSTSGSIALTGVNAMAQAIVISGAAQTSGGTTLTIVDQAGVSRNLLTGSLTATRVPFASSAGILTDDSDMTFATDTLTVTKIGATTLAGTATLAENSSIALDPAGSADGKYTGITVTGTAGYTQAFGDLVYLDPTDSRWEACDANSAAGADGDSRGIIGMVVSAGTDGTACTILLHGIIRADAKFATFTINNPIYVSETAGAITQTQPTTTDVVIRIIGAALTADEIFFNPDFMWITHT